MDCRLALRRGASRAARALPGYQFRQGWNGAQGVACPGSCALRFVAHVCRLLLWSKVEQRAKVGIFNNPGLFHNPGQWNQVDTSSHIHELCRRQLFAQLNSGPTLFEIVTGKVDSGVGSKRARTHGSVRLLLNVHVSQPGYIMTHLYMLTSAARARLHHHESYHSMQLAASSAAKSLSGSANLQHSSMHHAFVC
jgi:hypothetical protein